MGCSAASGATFFLARILSSSLVKLFVMNDYSRARGTFRLSLPLTSLDRWRSLSPQDPLVSPVDVDVLRQVNMSLTRNLDFCQSGQGSKAWSEVLGLREDFKSHLAWVMGLGHLSETFSRHAVPNYLVRVLHPLSQSLRVNLLLGMLPDCFLEVRALTEQLARAFQADLKFSKEASFTSKLSRLDVREPSLYKLTGETDSSVLPLLSELGHGWVRMDQPLTGMGASLPVSAASTTYTSRDVPELLRLTSAVKRFRELLSKTMSQWSSKLEKKDSTPPFKGS